MIKASELRIGNCIWDDTLQRVKFVTHRVISDLASSAEPLPYSPIALTREWLVRCGFNKLEQVIGIYEDELHYSYRNHKLELTFTVAYVVDRSPADITRIRIRLDGEILFVPKGIIHLHQLQNIYHALTGDEITIKQ